MANKTGKSIAVDPKAVKLLIDKLEVFVNDVLGGEKISHQEWVLRLLTLHVGLSYALGRVHEIAAQLGIAEETLNQAVLVSVEQARKDERNEPCPCPDCKAVAKES